MTPNKTNKVSENQCDILYTFNPVSGGGRTDSGTDKRRFTFNNDNCNWTVISMGEHNSGTAV